MKSNFRNFPKFKLYLAQTLINIPNYVESLTGTDFPPSNPQIDLSNEFQELYYLFCQDRQRYAKDP